ncbi:unnamed protein product [Brugia timori]|uniref:DUF4220 domain-containing protein n=1 Tax=Brugia timori TaxID=42155 RepID=A0A0R3QKZ3_9BILA|nr:unnamed protein product [Brugia timori]
MNRVLNSDEGVKMFHSVIFCIFLWLLEQATYSTEIWRWMIKTWKIYSESMMKDHKAMLWQFFKKSYVVNFCKKVHNKQEVIGFKCKSKKTTPFQHLDTTMMENDDELEDDDDNDNGNSGNE